MASWDARRAKEDTNVCLPDPKPRKRQKASQGDWEAIHAQFEHAVCTHCAMRPIELHHVVPRSQGGDDVVANLVPLCHRHHTILEAHASGWERVAASVRPYVLLNRGRCVYVIGKIGWDRFNKRYPMLSEGDRTRASLGPQRTKGRLSAPVSPSESDWEADYERFEGPTWRYRPPEDALAKNSWSVEETG